MILSFMLEINMVQRNILCGINWYSTEDDSINMENSTSNNDELTNLNDKEKVPEQVAKKDPKPLVVFRKQKIEISGPPPPKRRPLTKEGIDISFIIDQGMLKSGVRSPRSVKALQEALLVLGYDLGEEVFIMMELMETLVQTQKMLLFNSNLIEVLMQQMLMVL